jgi:hypothetical protein
VDAFTLKSKVSISHKPNNCFWRLLMFKQSASESKVNTRYSQYKYYYKENNGSPRSKKNDAIFVSAKM